MKQNRDCYKRFASVYDEMSADHFSVDMVEYTERIMRKFDINPETGLDLCCGTGTALKLLADSGIEMTGLDRSAGMLREARKKLSGSSVKLLRQSLPDFRIKLNPEGRKLYRFDLVTCFYDSLNYLNNESELKTAFRSIYLHLNRGGWFVFDMNTPEALKIIWGGQIWGGVKEKVSWIFRNEYDDEELSAKLHATFFVKKGKYWERFDELHREKAYGNNTVKRLLRESGLKVRGFYRCLSLAKPSSRTYRICAVCQRPD